MTVAELIALLETYPPDASIDFDGYQPCSIDECNYCPRDNTVTLK